MGSLVSVSPGDVLRSLFSGSTQEHELMLTADVLRCRCNVWGEDRRVLGLELDRDHHAVFVAFSGCVIRVPLSRCSDFSTCKK